MSTLNLQLGASAHDAVQQSNTSDQDYAPTSSGLVVLSDGVLQIGGHGLNNMWFGYFWFNNVTIPQGATINSANFILKAQATWDAGAHPVKFWLSAQANDNAAIPAASPGTLNATARPRGTQHVAWVQTSIVAEADQTVSITAVVQEVINRAGWASGNALGVCMDVHQDCDDNEWQEYYGYDNTPSKSAKLQIDYTTSNPPVARQTIIRQAVKRASFY